MILKNRKTILLTFDVEDWFQVENFKEYIPFYTWDSHKLRVEKNTNIILDLLDSFTFKPKATFFVLGWIAERLPDLVREIEKRGHEIASHGNHHHLCTEQDLKEVFIDLENSKKFLEDVIGKQVFGYRAPSFAINNDVLNIVKEAGYTYDSSYNSFSMHGRYGTIDLPKNSEGCGIYKLGENFFELPISNLTILQKTIPLGGGGYFRAIPFSLFKLAMDYVLHENNTFLFYSHPWEFDPNQPKIRQASARFKFRHYINLNKTQKKLKSMINCFSELNFTTCIDHLKPGQLL